MNHHQRTVCRITICGLSCGLLLSAITFATKAIASPKKAAIATSAPGIPATSLPWVAIKNGWGPVEKNKSNGEKASGDGKPITLHKKKYKFGFGCHAPSEIRINIGGRYKMFISDIGIDDEVKGRGAVILKTRVVFKIMADNQQIFDSGPLTAASPIKTVKVSVKGKKQLRLIVITTGHSANQHVDWAGARFLR